MSLDPRLFDATPEEIRATTATLSDFEVEQLLYDWQLWGRPEQQMPAGDWFLWLILAGRGFGKSRSGAEAVRKLAATQPGQRIALIGPTAGDCRDVMIEGESGLLNIFPPNERPHYEPSKRKITFANGSVGHIYSAEEPERLRGPQHHHAWLDEIAVYPDIDLLWSNLKFGLRLGIHPRIIATTTPKPSKFLREIIADPGTVITRGRTADNRANLPASALAEFERLYGGTRIGRQELEGELLSDTEGALWKLATIDATRVRREPDLKRIVIAIDPSVTAGEDSDECGIVVTALGMDDHGYVLGDLSGVMAPDVWAAKAVAAYDANEADKVIAEVNNGGDMVGLTIKTVRPNIPFEKVTASRGKMTRAEPVAALYEQGKVHHVGGYKQLEDEMCNWVPGMRSPNRMDAVVWGLSWLMLKPKREGRSLAI